MLCECLKLYQFKTAELFFICTTISQGLDYYIPFTKDCKSLYLPYQQFSVLRTFS